MEPVLEFLTAYQWWIYGILGLILLFYLRRALLARRDGTRSIFKLEQEQARIRYTRSVTILAVVLQSGGPDSRVHARADANPDVGTTG